MARLRRSKDPAIALVCLLMVGALASGLALAQPARGGIEPSAGSWRTWVLTSGHQLRVPPPPDRTATAAEVSELRGLAARRDGTARALIVFWDTGAPPYRWNEIAINEALKNNLPSNLASRVLALGRAVAQKGDRLGEQGRDTLSITPSP